MALRLRMARSLMDTISQDFHLDELRDEYTAALEQVIAAKIEGAEPGRAPAAAISGGRVVALMAALEASLASAQQAHNPTTPGAPRRRPPRRRPLPTRRRRRPRPASTAPPEAGHRARLAPRPRSRP
jgi:DNA end-binding protein Ku